MKEKERVCPKCGYMIELSEAISHDIEDRLKVKYDQQIQQLKAEPQTALKQKDQEYMYIGRSECDAPEVDGCVYVRSNEALQPGAFVEVTITDACEYDLTGEVV